MYILTESDFLRQKQAGMFNPKLTYIRYKNLQVKRAKRAEEEFNKLPKSAQEAFNKLEMNRKRYSLEYILGLVVKSNTTKKVLIDDDLIKVSSLRLQCFKEKGTVCVTCGMHAEYFAKTFQYQNNTVTYHLNLYGTDEFGQEILFTQDHIQPVSKNGKDHLDNLQTMCVRCNAQKGNTV